MTAPDRQRRRTPRAANDAALAGWAAEQVATVCKPFRDERSSKPFAPGVVQDSDSVFADRYIGTADALMACGLVRLDQLPGQPGNGKTQCTYDSDGRRVPKGRSKGADPGGISVERIGATRFRVSVYVSREERERRRSAYLIRTELETEAARPDEVRPPAPPPAAQRPVSRATVDCLTKLLAEAVRGELTGFAYVAMSEGYKYHVRAVGRAFDDPIPARGMAMQLSDYLGDIARGADEDDDDEDDGDD